MCGCLSFLMVLVFVYIIIVAIVLGRWELVPYYLVGLGISCLLLYLFRDDRG
jgi:hypothetical protein